MAYDLTGSGVTYNSTGKFGASLNGGTAQIAGSPLPSSGPFTVQGWIRGAPSSGTQVFVGQGGAFWVGAGAGGPISLNWGPASSNLNIVSGITPTGSNDYFWEFSNDPVNNVLRFFVGDAAGNVTLAGSDARTMQVQGATYTSPFEVRQYLSSFFYSGEIDEVAVFSNIQHTSAFTAPAAPTANSASGIRALYHFNNNLLDSAAASVVLPGAPTIGVATAGVLSATVTFTPGTTGTNSTTSFIATASTGETATGTASPIAFSGLSAGVARTFHVQGISSDGTGPASAESNSVTPTASGDTTPPTLTGVVTIGTVTSSTVAASWPAGSDNVAVVGYERSLDGGSTYSSVGNVTSATIAVSPGTTYPALKIRCFDAAGLRSTPAIASAAGFTTPASSNIAVTDPNWKWSPNSWDTNGGVKTAVNGGAYCKLGFTGTGVTVAIDVSSLVAGGVPTSWYPILRYMVDGGVQTDIKLTPSTTQLAITGLAAGTHNIKILYLAGWWENTGGSAPDRWTNPTYCIRITGATLASGGVSAAPVWRPKVWLDFGDSIDEGIRSNYATAQPECQNSYDTVPLYVAAAFDAEIGNISWGGINYAAGFNTIPATNTSYTSYFNGRSRLTGGIFTEQPDFISVCLGTNGAPAQSDVQTFIANMRAKAPSARIFVRVPVGGFGRSSITDAVAAYQSANPSETKVHLIDLGTSWQVGLGAFTDPTEQSIDGIHPRANWNARIASAVVQKMQQAIDGAASPTLTARTFTLSGIKIDKDTLATGLTNVKVSLRDASGPDIAGLLSYQSSTQTITGGVLSFTANTTLGSGGTGWIDIKAPGVNYCGQVVAS